MTSRPSDGVRPGPGRSNADARGGGAAVLPVGEAYRLWADRYDGEETVVTALDEQAVRAFAVPLSGRTLLDAGCGTGRRMPRPEEVGRAIGVDLVYEMLAAGRRSRNWLPPLVAADLRALPFGDGSFDIVWCRLAIGYVPDPAGAYLELARVARGGSDLIVTDFHPEAVEAGHRRTFLDAAGRTRTIDSHLHLPADHERAAGRAGWTLVASLDLAVDETVRPLYERAGRHAQYRAQRGLPLVLALRFTR